MTERLSALKENPLSFFANKNPKCPHCGEDFDIDRNEAWFLYDESDTHDVDCPRCDMEFRVNPIASWSFSTDEQEEV
jgi:uncharacterized Zn-finger protein